MSTKPLKQGATYADLCDVPDNFVAEMFDGDLYASPRPAIPHAHAASVLGIVLGDAFHLGRSGPGGWLFLDEPELHFGNDVLVPDLAAWRRERMRGAGAGVGQVVFACYSRGQGERARCAVPRHRARARHALAFAPIALGNLCTGLCS